MLKRLLCSLVLSLILIASLYSPVWAIGNPTSVSIGDIYVFRNVLVTGDQLYYVRYDVDYAGVPSEPATDTWLMVLYDTDGTTIRAVRPLNYYEENIISIYLTPTQALTWAGAYVVRITGNPGLFSPLVEGTNMRSRTLGSGDYHEKTDLATIMLAQADILETNWGITLLSTNKLNSTGAYYFNKAIPSLNLMASEIYEVTLSSMTNTTTNYSTNGTTMLATHKSTTWTEVESGMGDLLHTSDGFAGFFVVVVFMLMFGASIFAYTRSTGIALSLVSGSIPVYAWLAFNPVFAAIITAIFLVAGLLVGMYFFGKL